MIFENLKFFMRNLFLLLLTVAFLLACSGKDAPQGAGGKPAKGGRSLNVEGYIAEFSNQKQEFQTMATLEANNSVSLSAAVSGRFHLVDYGCSCGNMELHKSRGNGF